MPENLNIVDIKLAIIEHPKTSHKLSKTIRQVEKVSKEIDVNQRSTSPLYSTTKKWKMFEWKNAKLTKRSHAYKGCTSNYNVKTFNSVNPELQLKDTESSIKNKLIDLLSELRGLDPWQRKFYCLRE